MRHRRVEGSCRASAWHGSARPKVECTARTHCLLHSAKRDDKPFSHSAGADPSAWQRAQLPRPAWYKLGGHAHGRSLWVGCVRPPPQVPPSHAGDSSSAPSEPSEQSSGRQMPPRGSLVTPNSFPGSSRYCASCLLCVKWSVTMKTVDFLPGEGSLSTRARTRFKIVKP